MIQKDIGETTATAIMTERAITDIPEILFMTVKVVTDIPEMAFMMVKDVGVALVVPVIMIQKDIGEINNHTTLYSIKSWRK